MCCKYYNVINGNLVRDVFITHGGEVMEIGTISSVSGAASYQSKPADFDVKKKVQVEAVEEKSIIASQAAVVSASVVAKTAEENGAQGSESDSQKENQPNEQGIKNAVKDINKLINRNTVAEFGYHEATKRITIKIKDKDTDELIKEIPSEKALEMLEKAWEIAGILVDEKR